MNMRQIFIEKHKTKERCSMSKRINFKKHIKKKNCLVKKIKQIKNKIEIKKKYIFINSNTLSL
jgi:hypothetical protein